MTDLQDLKELAEAAESVAPSPWLERPQKHDDWGTIRQEAKNDFGFQPMVVRVRASKDDTYDDAQMSAHRASGTDPYQEVMSFIAAANPKTILELIARVEAAEERLETEAKVRRQAEAIVDGQSGEVFDLRSALEQAKAREAELLGALEPFAKLAEFWLERASIHGLDDEDTCATEIEFGHLRNAVTAMGGDDNG